MHLNRVYSIATQADTQYIIYTNRITDSILPLLVQEKEKYYSYTRTFFLLSSTKNNHKPTLLENVCDISSR